MAKVKITGHASGSGVITVTAPNTSTDRTITLPDATSTIATTTDVAARLPSITDGGNATAMTINATENVGVGVVPEAWNSVYDAIQVGNTASIAGYTGGDIDRAWVTANGYVNTSDGNWQYINTDTASQHEQRDGTHNFFVAASGSADATITWTTGLEVLNAGQARVKNGLLFGTDTASTNTLDDYEIGTWSPSLLGATFANQTTTGRYIKIGRLVHIQYYTAAFNISNASGAARIGNLPYAPLNASGHHCVINYCHGTAVVGAANLYLDHSNATMYFVTNDSTSSPAWTNGNSKYVMISGTYQTA